MIDKDLKKYIKIIKRTIKSYQRLRDWNVGTMNTVRINEAVRVLEAIKSDLKILIKNYA